MWRRSQRERKQLIKIHPISVLLHMDSVSVIMSVLRGDLHWREQSWPHGLRQHLLTLTQLRRPVSQQRCGDGETAGGELSATVSRL